MNPSSALPGEYHPASSLASVRRVYRRDGFAVVRSVLDEATRDACIEHLAGLGGGGPIRTGSLEADPFLAEIAADTRFTAIAGVLLGAPPVAFGCSYLIKEPRLGLPVLWHQDGHPWRADLGIEEAVTLWVALDPADGTNGGLQVIPGSHVRPAEPLRPSPVPANIFGAGTDPAVVDAALADGGRTEQVVLAAGDLEAHHPQLLHGSPANPSGRRRRALVVRYRPRPSTPRAVARRGSAPEDQHPG